MTVEQIRDALAKYDKYPKLGDRAYFSFSDIRTLLAALDTKTSEISSELVARQSVERQRDYLLEQLVALFDWGSDPSYTHAIMHVENAVRNIRSDLKVCEKERDALRAEVEKLKKEVDCLNSLRKYNATLLSQEWQTASDKACARAAERAEVYLARLGVPPAGAAGSVKKLDGIPIRPTVLLLASCACSIAGFYSEQARWFLIPALAFIIIALFCT